MSDDKQTVCIFGDSITWGQYDPEGGGWAQRLRHHLENTWPRRFETFVLGVPGDDTNDLLRRFQVECEARQPDIIVFAIGANDAQGIGQECWARVDMLSFEANLRKLLVAARQFTDDITFVGLTAVDEAVIVQRPGKEPVDFSNTRIALRDTAIWNICNAEKIPYIEVRHLLEPKDLDDGVHPTSVGHEKLFKKIMAELPWVPKKS